MPCWVVFDSQYRSRYAVLVVPAGRAGPELAPRGARPLRSSARPSASTRSPWRDTVEQFNRYVAAGTRRRLRSRRERLRPLQRRSLGAASEPRHASTRRPFYALPVHPGAVGTKGGPVVNEHAEVIDVRGDPIPGLYAAGNVMANPAGPAYFGGGCSIGTGIVWGFLAGERRRRRGRLPPGDGSRHPRRLTDPAGTTRSAHPPERARQHPGRLTDPTSRHPPAAGHRLGGDRRRPCGRRPPRPSPGAGRPVAPRDGGRSRAG